jgi:hypothetical protein
MPGGERMSLSEWHGHEQLSYWWHAGPHPAYAESVRFGRYNEHDEHHGDWYVTWSGTPPSEWRFPNREDAYAAVLLLKSLRDGEWENRQAQQPS